MRSLYRQFGATVVAGGSLLLLTPASPSAAPQLYASAQVLEQFCDWSGGRLYFAPPSGGRWELITDINDPEIANKGDGSFHPMSDLTVREAVDAIAYPLDALTFDIYVLPYPRRGHARSSAGEGVIYLAPGTREIADEQVHSIVAHEIGHQVHRAYLPFDDVGGWTTFARIRGYFGDPRYAFDASHAYRPQEVFAEDFRALFGSPLARASGTIENRELSYPSDVPGLVAFFEQLPVHHPHRPLLAASPNPSASHVRIDVDLQLGGAGASIPGVAPFDLGNESTFSLATMQQPWSVTIFDARGRLVRQVPVQLDSGGQAHFSWDGSDQDRRRVGRGIYFARLSNGAPGSRPVATLKIVRTR